jgi:hypothetical protein
MSDSTFISPTVQMAGVGAPSPTPTPVQSTPISVDTLDKGASTPINIPPPTPMTPVTHNVPPPTGTTTDANGNAIIPPPAKTSATDQLQGLIDKLGTKESVENDLNNKYQTDALLNAKTTDYNAYIKAQQDQNDTLAQMTNEGGMDKFGFGSMANAYKARTDAEIANLAIKSQLSSGLYTDAEDSITKKLDSIFSPIKDQASLLVEMQTMKNNDMTDSEKELAKLKSDQLTKDADNVQSVSKDIQSTLAKNGNYSAVAPKIDKINQDFVDGKITAAEAQSQMYAAASKYTLNSSSNSNYVVGENPIVDSHIINVLSGNETMAQVPANLRNQVSLGLTEQPSSSYSPLAASRFTTAATRITNQFTNIPAYQLTAGGQVYLDRINAALQTPGSISDQDLIDSLTKLNTGGNAISDAQVKLVTDGKSFADMANVLKNKLGNGGVLSDTQRTQLSTIANAIFKNYQKTYEPIYKQASAQLTAAGIPKAFWTIPDLNTLSTQTTTGGNNTSTLPADIQSMVKTGTTVDTASKTAYITRDVWNKLGANMDAVLAEAKADGYTLLVK